MNLEQRVAAVKHNLEQGFYTIAARECVTIIEQAFKVLFRRHLTRLQEQDRLLVQKVEAEIGKGKRGIDNFTMGELIGLFRQSKFIEAWGRATGKELRSIRTINLDALNDYRIHLTHHDGKADKADAEQLFGHLRVILETFGIESLEESISATPRLKEGPGVVTPHASKEISIAEHAQSNVIIAGDYNKVVLTAEDKPASSKEATQVIFQIPFARNPYFSSRDALLDQLHTELATHQPIALSGLGGVGKTQTAVEYAYRYQAEYHAIFWVSASDNVAIHSGVAAIAMDLGLDAQGTPTEIQAVVKAWLRQASAWLLIIDNADELDQMTHVLTEVLPTVFTGHVLVTTRHQSPPSPLKRFPLEILTDEQGAELLLRRTADQNPCYSHVKSSCHSHESGNPDTLTMDSRLRGNDTPSDVKSFCHSHESGNPGPSTMDSRLRGNDTPSDVKPSCHSHESGNPDSSTMDSRLRGNDTPSTTEGGFTQHPDYALAVELSHTMQGLPLALAQAAAYLYKRRCGYAKYLALYQQNAARLLKERGELLFNQDHPLPVATTWDISFAQVEHKQPRALELLRYCAFLATEGIPEEILLKVLNTPRRLKWLPFHWVTRLIGRVSQVTQIDLEDLLDPILSYSLLTRDAESRQVQIHGLVQTVLRSQLTAAQQQAFVEPLVTVVRELFPRPDSIENWPVCERLLSSALACADGIAQYQLASETAALLLNQTAYYLDNRVADYAQALSLYERSLAIRQQTSGPHHPDIATALNNLASLYQVQGEYDQAQPLFERSLAIREQVLGPHHPDVAASLNNLAYLYYTQGEYAQVKPLLERSLAIREQVLGPHHPDVALSLNNLAFLYKEQGEYDQAQPLYERSLAILEQTLGPHHPDVATSLNNLAHLYQAQGEYAQVKPLLERSLAIYEQVLGPHHPDVAKSLNNLAFLYKEQGEYDQAQPLYERALVILKKTLGERHPNTQTVAGNYQKLLEKMGK